MLTQLNTEITENTEKIFILTSFIKLPFSAFGCLGVFQC